MRSITFKALLTSIHIDPVKGTQKIQLIPTSYVSVDTLTMLSLRDENIRVTLESAQIQITDVGDPIILDEEAAEKLKDAAERLKEEAKREEEKEGGKPEG